MTRTALIKYYRTQIDKIVTRQERINILAKLNATTREFIDGKFKVRNNPNLAISGKGYRLLTAINDFDSFCLKSDEEYIKAGGDYLIECWKKYKDK